MATLFQKFKVYRNHIDGGFDCQCQVLYAGEPKYVGPLWNITITRKCPHYKVLYIYSLEHSFSQPIDSNFSKNYALNSTDQLQTDVNDGKGLAPTSMSLCEDLSPESDTRRIGNSSDVRNIYLLSGGIF